MKEYFDKKKVNSIGTYIDQVLGTPSELALATSAGYPKKEFDNAAKLYKEIMELRQVSKVALGRRFSATDAFNYSVEQLKEHYGPVKEIAYILFEDDREAYYNLDLSGPRDDSFDGMKTQVRILYEGILGNANYLADLNKKGISQEHLQAGLKLHADMLELKRIQLFVEHERKEAVQTLLVKVNELEKWHSKAKRIIRAYSKVKPI
ncbi:hypothetical protein R9C00_15655 [Flammeovirgaceae bacterium SG7u.111]|nr:hypothetical protein [Flammeovirgaceae bacterium SG7u.132]WPO33137.1 hypothetical protein R9C00_15655 [Flammeovirgaceae bacterium SG7u.111]